MFKKLGSGKDFYGTTTIGEKGQVVIPIEARKALNIKKGEKLLVLRAGGDMLAFVKLTKISQFARHLSQKLNVIKKIIRKTKN